MANKLVAAFLMCIVVVAAFSFHEAKALDDTYKSCFDPCKTGCLGEGNGESFCEVKCDHSCEEEEVAGN
jgi:hypothetical protein